MDTALLWNARLYQEFPFGAKIFSSQFDRIIIDFYSKAYLPSQQRTKLPSLDLQLNGSAFARI